jgi:hypothetical protein
MQRYSVPDTLLKQGVNERFAEINYQDVLVHRSGVLPR